MGGDGTVLHLDCDYMTTHLSKPVEFYIKRSESYHAKFFFKFKKRNGKVISYPSTSFNLSAQRQPQCNAGLMTFQWWKFRVRLVEIFWGMIF